MGSSFAREFACCASRRIYIVWFSSTPSFVLCKRKKSNQTITLLAGGRGWIRTTEVIDDRFTVCSLCPLGNSSTIGAGERTRTPDLLITNQLLYQLSYTSLSLFSASLPSAYIIYHMNYRLSSVFFEFFYFFEKRLFLRLFLLVRAKIY